MQPFYACWLVFCTSIIGTTADELGHEAYRAYPSGPRLNQASRQSSSNDVSLELNVGTMRDEPSAADSVRDTVHTAGLPETVFEDGEYLIAAVQSAHNGKRQAGSVSGFHCQRKSASSS